ncbi:ribose 5-phosphate isomerase A [Granulicella aggregans]|uniref:Ribose-5-phosphate isomerase A n=1 Tax=Granulicella aggregans TaxID=474949 RepID=A0A7W7ZI53_9BACT|nr:ribose-5-phosphate isomerase RpiA [Granulicella aggregans]MBB5059984.1 ribose 5-phosphate isomerase A [Granulicella aggregans]
MTQDEAKRLVAKRAVEFVEDGMAVGLGTGSTSRMFIEELGAKVKASGIKIRCVASSDASKALGESLGLEVVSLAELPELDVYIDGADEVARDADGSLALIKGGGGALLREKIVASSAKKFIVVVDSSKVVAKLGKFPLPIEVIKMALPLVEGKLTELGLNPKQRKAKDGSVYLTDENNYILDCSVGVIENPEETAAEVRGIVGVVEHGLFLGMAAMALVAGDDGVTEMQG